MVIKPLDNLSTFFKSLDELGFNILIPMEGDAYGQGNRVNEINYDVYWNELLNSPSKRVWLTSFHTLCSTPTNLR